MVLAAIGVGLFSLQAEGVAGGFPPYSSNVPGVKFAPASAMVVLPLQDCCPLDILSVELEYPSVKFPGSRHGMSDEDDGDHFGPFSAALLPRQEKKKGRVYGGTSKRLPVTSPEHVRFDACMAVSRERIGHNQAIALYITLSGTARSPRDGLAGEADQGNVPPAARPFHPAFPRSHHSIHSPGINLGTAHGDTSPRMFFRRFGPPDSARDTALS